MLECYKNEIQILVLNLNLAPIAQMQTVVNMYIIHTHHPSAKLQQESQPATQRVIKVTVLHVED
ncbi:hypothetical protein ABT58_15105 [Photobacterium aphoticum]|uniref:Uncharacterized protein n=1 Tax=Photobacterium aphoticum TaxID=754436 RepID=A0A0J1JDW5_9GAMM|nr:hypothetical protein ABT58_15105 [Photobacterium aphoticum]